MKRALVTGATGFVGRQTCLPLLERGYEVHAVTRYAANGLPSDVIAHRADLLDCDGHRALLERIRPSHLLHSAWYVEHGKYWNAADNALWLKASLSLIEAFCQSGGARVVGVGTCAEYDWRYGLLVESETPELPTSLYGSAKLAAGISGAALAAAHGVQFSWARIFFAYGPGEPVARLVPYVITSLLRGMPARCSHGSQFHDFLYVADVGAALAGLLDNTVCGPVNIGSGVPLRISDVATRLAEALGRVELLMLGAVPEAANSARMILASTTRLVEEVGWVPLHSLDERLAQTIDWWRDEIASENNNGTLIR